MNMDKSTILEFKPMIETWGGFFSNESLEEYGANYYLEKYLVPELKKLVRKIFDAVIDEIGVDHVIPRFLAEQYEKMIITINQYGSIEYNNILDDLYILQPFMYFGIEDEGKVKKELLNELVTEVKRYPYKVKIEEAFFVPSNKEEIVKKFKYNPLLDVMYNFIEEWGGPGNGKAAVKKGNKIYVFDYEKISVDNLDSVCSIDEVINRIQEYGNGTLICVCDL